MTSNKNNRWRLSTQLSVVFGATCLVAVILADIWIRHFETDYLLTNFEEKNKQTALLLSHTIVTPLLQNDLAELDEHITAMLNVDDTLLQVRVLNPAGTLLSSSNHKQKVPLAPDHPSIQHIRLPVNADEQHIANIEIAWDSTFLHQNISHHVNLMRGMVLFTLGLLSLVLLNSLTRLVVFPVNKINHKLQALTKGSSTEQIHPNRLLSKELHFLSHVSNQLDDLQQQQLEAQKSLAIAKDKAEAANTTKNEFLGVVSHELRTPINGVLGLLELLMKDKTLSDEQANHINIAHASTDSLLAIVSNILDFSTIEAGKMEVKSLELNLRQLVNEVSSMFTSSAINKGLSLSSHNDPELPESLMGDPMRIRQVLSNLILNGIKFTDQGSITVTTSLVEQNQDTAMVRISVTDTGIGIDKQQQDSLFSSFYQADTSATRRHGGAGLGLAITHKLVSAMQGKVTLDSQLGQGSTFCFTLPLKIMRTPQITPTTQTDDLPLLHGKLLLAEDNPVNKLVAMKMLRSFGLKVVHAKHGQEAVELFCQEHFDAVLMDIQMPEMDGYQATTCIRKWETEEHREHTPIIALTANVLSEDRARCFTVGMDDFLAKPIKIKTLHHTLQEWLQKTATTT